MKKDEYVIISKKVLLKKIKDLEEKYLIYMRLQEEKLALSCKETQFELKQVLSQSTPLIPVLEDAFNKGVNWTLPDQSVMEIKISKKDYISKLKLDI